MKEGEDKSPGGNFRGSSKLPYFLEFHQGGGMISRRPLPPQKENQPTHRGLSPSEKTERSPPTPQICFYSSVRLTSGSKWTSNFCLFWTSLPCPRLRRERVNMVFLWAPFSRAVHLGFEGWKLVTPQGFLSSAVSPRRPQTLGLWWNTFFHWPSSFLITTSHTV